MNEQRTGQRGGRPADRGNVESATFTRNLRYEFASEEGRALMGSYAISFLLAAAFLLFVYLYPPIEPEPEPRIIVMDLPPELPPPPEPQPQPQPEEAVAPAAPTRPTPTRERRPSSPRTTQTSGGDVADAFRGAGSTGGVAGRIAGQVRGVDVAGGSGNVGGGGTGTRAVIEGGAGTGTAPTAGRGGVRGGSTSGIGEVGGSGTVARGTVGMRPPSVIEAPALGESRDMGDLGTFVRNRQRELQFCYEEHGLKANPNLGGTIHVSIGIAGNGRVTSASVNRRTWSGAGVSAVESCVLGKIRAWRFPSSSAGDGVYSFPFNFTR